MDEYPQLNPKVRKAVLAGLAVEGPLLVAGAVYLVLTGLYEDPRAWVALVVIAAVAGVGAGAIAYLRARGGRTR